MIITVAVDTGVDISLVQYIFSLMYWTWYGYSFTCKLTLCSNHLLTTPREGALLALSHLTLSRWPHLSPLSHTVYQYTGVTPVPFPPAGDNDTVVYLEEVPLQAFPMFKGIVFCRRQPKIFSPASYGIAHNCVSNNGTWLPSLNMVMNQPSRGLHSTPKVEVNTL